MNIKSKGFTLIELLVVVAIISLLTSVVLASLTEVREKSKVAKFQQELGSLVKALELYKTDYGYYPGGNLSPLNNWQTFVHSTQGYRNSTSTIGYLDLESILVPTYIPKIPIPPTHEYIYSYVNVNDIRCANQDYFPEYLLMIDTSIGGFNQLPFLYFAARGGSISSTYRCLSI